MTAIAGLAEARAALAAQRRALEAEESLMNIVERLANAARDAGYAGTVTLPSPGEVMVLLRREGVQVAPECPTPDEEEADEGAPRPTLRAGPWSDAEVARLKEMRAAGADARQISDELRRDVRSVTGRMAALRAAETRTAKAAKSTAPAPAAAEHEPAPSVGRGAPPAVAASTGQDAPFWKRELADYLDTLGYRDPWSAKKDLQLVECLARGEGIVGAVEALGIERAHCIARWQSLNHMPGDIEHQRRLLEVLRERAAA